MNISLSQVRGRKPGAWGAQGGTESPGPQEGGSHDPRPGPLVFSFRPVSGQREAVLPFRGPS